MVPRIKCGAPMQRITASQAEKLAKTVGRHRADDNLYLHVRNTGKPTWLFRYVAPDGKRRDMSLGQFPALSLANARAETMEWREALQRGEDPLAVRKAAKDAVRREAIASSYTLRIAAQELCDHLRPSWKNAKHAQQWMNSLSHLGAGLLDKPLVEIETSELLAKLEAIHANVPETAKRIRQRIEATFDRAMLLGHVRHNPATPLKRALRKSKRKKHFAALPWQEIPAFITRIRQSNMERSSRLAFEYMILSVARTNEIINATWSQIDLTRNRWSVPAPAMKMDEDHHVPIQPRMREILLEAQSLKLAGHDWIFPSPASQTRQLSNNVFLAAIKRWGMKGNVTGHGMRSSFSDWAYETQPIRGDVIEAVLAHKEDDASKAAYARTDYWDLRVQLSAAWEVFALSGIAKT